MSDLNEIRADLAAALDHLRSIEARIGGATSDPVEIWPPDPLSINLHNGTWLLVPDAAFVAARSESWVRRRIRDENIAIQIGATLWVSRIRLLSGKKYPKVPDQI